MILASITFAILASVLILASNIIIKNSFINRSKLAVASAVSFEAEDLKMEDFSLKDPDHAREVFTEFYEKVKTAEIIRIKVWDYSAKVIFSDDQSIVGKRFPDNDEFKEALKGEVVTEIGEKTKSENISEQGYEQLLEVYVPVTFKGENVPSGVIEAYFKLDNVNSRIKETQLILILTIVTFTLASFGLLFIIFKLVIYKQIERINQQAEALKAEENMLQVLVDNLPVGVFTAKAPNGEVVTVNPRGKELLGRGIDPNARKGNYSEVYAVLKEDGTPYPNDELPASLVLATGKPAEKRDIYVQRPDRTKIALKAYGVPVKDVAGKLLFVTVVFDDITKEKAIDKAKTEFVSLASHQLRTPLSSMNWYAEMLLSGDAGVLSEKQKTYVEESYKAGRRMNHLINALLNLSGIELGTFIIEPKTIDVLNLIKSVLADFEPEILDKKIKIDFENTSQNITINADPKLLKVIIENLLSNALNFTRDLGKIILSVQEKAEGILISVKDNGIGIPEKEQQMVFTRLFRAENIGEVGGSGLGLYTVKIIIENIGGKIWFESKEGKGTTFYVTIPDKKLARQDRITSSQA